MTFLHGGLRCVRSMNRFTNRFKQSTASVSAPTSTLLRTNPYPYPILDSRKKEAPYVYSIGVYSNANEYSTCQYFLNSDNKNDDENIIISEEDGNNMNPVEVELGFPPINSSTNEFDYDLIIIGSGPAAQTCAIASARKGKKVLVLDKPGMVGGVCVHTGTIPSKTFREAVLHLTGYRHQGFYGKSYATGKTIDMDGILHRVNTVLKGQTDVLKNRFQKNKVAFVEGVGSFSGNPNEVLITIPGSGPNPIERKITYTAEKFLIATGTRPARREDLDFDGETIIDSDDILSGSVSEIPGEVVVIGAGVIGMEYASMFNIIPGSRVTVIEGRDSFLSFADREIIESLEYQMRQNGCRFLLGENVVSAKKDESTKKVYLKLESGKQVKADMVLYTVGRQGNSDELNLESVGLSANKRGLLSINKDTFQTDVDYIYAAGDIIGFPALASTSSQQGRLVANNMFGHNSNDDDITFPEDFPYGIYTIPEISMCGKTEGELTKAKIPYEVGLAMYEELAKGQMLGGQQGMLKVIFSSENKKVLGIHCIGENATEIVHVGMLAMQMNLTIDYFTETVFNYPTFAEAYRSAAFNGLKRLSSYSISST